MPQLWTTGDVPRRTRRPLPRAARIGLGLAVVGLLTSIGAAILMSPDGSRGCGEAVSTAAQVGFVLWLAAGAVMAAACLVGLSVRIIQGDPRGTTSIFATAIIGSVIEWLALVSTVQFCF